MHTKEKEVITTKASASQGESKKRKLESDDDDFDIKMKEKVLKSKVETAVNKDSVQDQIKRLQGEIKNIGKKKEEKRKPTSLMFLLLIANSTFLFRRFFKTRLFRIVFEETIRFSRSPRRLQVFGFC